MRLYFIFRENLFENMRFDFIISDDLQANLMEVRICTEHYDKTSANLVACPVYYSYVVGTGLVIILKHGIKKSYTKGTSFVSFPFGVHDFGRLFKKL